jgi:anti-sigma-K factor RskA
MMPDSPDERSATAAEYVMGTLGAAERAEFEHALTRDFALQQEVYYWQDKLLPMAGVLKPVEPSPDLWARIERGMDGGAAAGSRPGAGWWHSLAFWRLGAMAAAVVAIVLALRLIGPGTGVAPPADAGRYLAILQSPDKTAGWIVEAAAGGKLRLIPLVTTTVAPQKALQFWTKTESASGPTSLGLVPPDRVTEIEVAKLPALEPNQLFELTLEPATGSPLGRPTGPILFVGRTVAIN